jgi:hypothetical protein
MKTEIALLPLFSGVLLSVIRSPFALGRGPRSAHAVNLQAERLAGKSANA